MGSDASKLHTLRANAPRERKGLCEMARARKRAIDPAAALYARAADDPALAAILDALVDRMRLWRPCTGQGCQRARICRGDAVACGARRWPRAKSLLLQGVRARRVAPAAPPAARPLPQRPAARGTKAAARKITIDWRDKRDGNA
jgi:hypothetical protein